MYHPFCDRFLSLHSPAEETETQSFSNLLTTQPWEARVEAAHCPLHTLFPWSERLSSHTGQDTVACEQVEKDLNEGQRLRHLATTWDIPSPSAVSGGCGSG